MAKVKTYWDEIKNKETFYSGGSCGWEVHLRYANTYKFNPKTGETKVGKSLQFQFPFYSGDGVSREEKALTRKEVIEKRKLEKILASASANSKEYGDLRRRVYANENAKEEVFKLYDDGLKGFPLRNYISEHYLTESEGYSLFWRM